MDVESKKYLSGHKIITTYRISAALSKYSMAFSQN